jgi:hypothetical protein
MAEPKGCSRLHHSTWALAASALQPGSLQDDARLAFPAYGAVYGCHANSNLVLVAGFLSDESTTRGTAARFFEDDRDVEEEV